MQTFSALPARLVMALTVAVTSGVCLHDARAQSWQQQQQQQQWQRQQDQQRQQQDQARQQQQQADRQRMQDQQRQQMQDQMRQQQQQQMRQQMQDQQRQQMQSQQRQQLQAQQQTQQRQQAQQQQQTQQRQQQQTAQQQRAQFEQQGRLGKDGKPTGMSVVGGVAKMNRPLTPGEIQRGFTGKVTSDGKALIKYQGRVFTVPASRVSGLTARLAANQNEKLRSTRWTQQQQVALSGRISAVATAGIGGNGDSKPPISIRSAFNEAATMPGTVQKIPLQARQRQAAILKDNVGFNINPASNDERFSSVGSKGTFITDRFAIESLIPNFQRGGDRLKISSAQARKIETDLGLEKNSISNGFNIRRIENVRDLSPRSPINYQDNNNFKGAGQHLPGGHPELVIDSVLAKSDRNVSRTIRVDVVD